MKNIPIFASLPVLKEYLTEKVRKNLRIIVRETFYREIKGNYFKNNPYILPISQKRSKVITKIKKVLYNAPIDWEAKPENLVIKAERQK